MKYFLYILLFMFSVLTGAQERFVFSPINNGRLPDNRVRCLNQLKDGRMVVVSLGIVSIYDGVYFRPLHYNEEEAYYLKDYSGYHHTYISSDGKLWIKNEHKLIILDIALERFVPSIGELFLKQGINDSVVDIFMDSDQNFWYITKSNDLMLKKPDEDKSTFFKPEIVYINDTRDVIYDIALRDGFLFIFYRSGLMVCYDFQSRKELYAENPFRENEKGVYTNTLMVVPRNQYLYQIRNSLNAGVLMRFNIKNKQWDRILDTPYRLNTLSVDNNGYCMVSTETGFWYIDENLNNKRFIPQLELVDGKIFHTEISTQYHDKNGGLWIGTVNRGLLYYHPDRFKFRNYGKTYFNHYGNSELRVSCFGELNNGILVGTQNGLFLLEKGLGNLYRYPGLPRDINCYSIYKTKDNSLWLCTGHNGLFELKGKNINKYTFKLSVYCLFGWDEDVLYAGTNKGLALFNRKTGKLLEIETSESTQVESVFQITALNKDIITGISSSGIFMYHLKNEKFVIPMEQGQIKHEMFKHSNHQYNCLLKDSRDLLWTGTNDGLNVWDHRLNKLYTFYMEDGLVNNVIQSIIEDIMGKIWVSTSNGISQIEITQSDSTYQYAFINYNQYDGVIENEFFPRSALISQNARIFWGGLDGFNEIDLSRLSKPYKPLKPLFIRFTMFGNEIRQGHSYNGNTILNQSVTTVKEINLKYNQNYFGFELSALNFVNPTRTYYKYKLEGVGEQWRVGKGDNGLGRVNYTNISPGAYTFKVYATREKGRWEGEYASILINIHPPVWKTKYAYFIYLLIIVLVSYVLISNYIRSNRLRNARKQKEQLDQMKFAFFTNVSHELRTPITLIMTPLDAIIKKINDVDLKNKLKGIYRNASVLLNTVNQLLDFRKLELRGENLELSYCNMGEFFETILLGFHELNDLKNINFNTDIQTKNEYAFIDKVKIQKIINNLLSNAYKYTSQGGSISFSIKKDIIPDNKEYVFKIEVKDTGCGIPENEIPKIFDRYYQSRNIKTQNTGSGIGLHLVKEYVNLHQGRIMVESKVNKGSLFTVLIPVHLQPDKQREQKDEKHPVQNKHKILLVEDNLEFMEFLKEELSNNYHILTANNGKQGLKKAFEHFPDLIISDIMMPEMSGTEMCNAIKKDINISHIPVILLSARSADSTQLEGFEAGADAYITKPFNMDILLTRIKHILIEQQKRKALFDNAIIVNPGMVTTTNVDKEFVKKAFDFIETNLNNSKYSVDQLSKDMCMDRTGLYRKLVALSGNTPTNFIRKIKLKKAAQLIKQGMTISEVSEAVGFNTISYFSKCFQEEFGVKPSKFK